MQNVANGCPGGRGDHTDPDRQFRQLLFMFTGKQTGGSQSGLEQLKLTTQGAFARFLHGIGQKLVIASRFVQADPAAYQHPHAIPG